MKRQRILWLAVSLLTPLVCMILPYAIYRIKGFLQNEHFYKGRPSSYWRNLVKSAVTDSKESIISGPILRVPSKSPIVRLYEYSCQTFDDLLDRLPIENDNFSKELMLVDLLKDDDPRVRCFALSGLGTIGTPSKDAFSTILHCLHDEDQCVRNLAAEVLRKIDN